MKTGLGRFSARHLSPATRPRASSSRPPATRCRPPGAPVYDPGAPCTITVELNTTDQADPYRHRADVTVTGPRTIEATADTWWDAWRAIYLDALISGPPALNAE